MLFLPIAWANINRGAGIESFKSKGLEFVFGVLVCADKPLDVSLDGETGGFCAPAEPLLKSFINRNGHGRSALLLYSQILRDRLHFVRPGYLARTLGPHRVQ